MSAAYGPVNYMLDTKSLQQILRNSTEFSRSTTNGIQWFIDNAISQIPNGSLVSRGVSGPGIASRDFAEKVMVVLLKISVGRLLNNQQAGNLAAFRKLISVMYSPESLPQSDPEFHMIFQVTDQRLATPGNINTIAGGSTTMEHDIVTRLDTKVVSIDIDAINIFKTIDPQRIADALSREFESAETAWELTAVVDHARYCARQPTIVDVCQLKKSAKINDSSKGAIITACQLSNLVCGSLNRNPRNFLSLVHACIKAVGSTPDRCVIVAGETLASTATTKLVSVKVTEQAKTFSYSTNNAVGLGNVAVFGKAEPEPGMMVLQHPSVPATHLLEARESVSEPREEGDTLFLTGVNMGTEGAVPIIPLDSTAFAIDGNTSVESTFMEPGVKRLFFTVGCAPQIYNRLNPTCFFKPGDKNEVTPGAVAMRDPSSSFIMDLDCGTSVKEIKLSQLHATFVELNNEAFSVANFKRRATNLVSVLGDFNEIETAELYDTDEWTEKIKSNQSVFEYDPRHMFVEHRGTRNATGAEWVSESVGAAQQNVDLIGVTPRECMYNSSPMSMRKVEMIGVAASMLDFAPENDALQAYIQMCMTALGDSGNEGVDQVFAVRGNTGALTDAMVAGLVENAGRYLPLSDPVCQLELLQLMSLYVTTAAASNVPEVKSNACIMKVYMNVIRDGMAAMLQLYGKLFSDEAHSIIHLMSQNGPIFAPAKVYSASERLFANISYMCVLTTLTNTIFNDSGSVTATDVNEHGLNGKVYFAYKKACFVADINSLPSANVVPMWSSPDTVNLYLVRPVWLKRMKTLRKFFGSDPQTVYMGVLVNLHLSSAINASTYKKHFDRNYYSGIAYMCVRTTRFIGHGMALMPKDSARFITGNRYTGKPIKDPCGREVWNQCMDYAIVPSGLDKLGVFIPDALITNLRGMGTVFDPENPNAIVISDAYNGFVPETKLTTAPIDNILPTCGRYDETNGVDFSTPDSLTKVFSQCPTLLFRLGSVFETLRIQIERLQLQPDHSFCMFMDSVTRGGVYSTLPRIYTQPAMLEDLEILKRVSNPSNCEDRTFYKNTLGLMFADCYVIGKNGEGTMRSKNNVTPIIAALSPKVIGETLVSDVLFGGEEYGFPIKLGKYSGINIPTGIHINAY